MDTSFISYLVDSGLEMEVIGVLGFVRINHFYGLFSRKIRSTQFCAESRCL